MTQPSLESLLQSAIAQHDAGRLVEAEALYRRILARYPQHALTLYRLGLLAYQTNHVNDAITLVQRAAQLDPNVSTYFGDLAVMLVNIDQIDAARQAAAVALKLQPRYPEVINALGIAFSKQEKYPQAIAEYQRAISLAPNMADTYCNLSHALNQTGQSGAALDAARRALQLRPDFPEAWNNLGQALLTDKQYDAACEAHAKALKLRDNFPEGWTCYGAALTAAKRPAESLAAYRRAAELVPDSPQAHYNLANCLNLGEQLFDAIFEYERAISLKPDFAHAHNNLGNVYLKLAEYDRALELFRKAVSLLPDYGLAHFNIALILLMHGHLREGLAEYEWRALAPELGPIPRWPAEPPMWDGSNLAGRRIMVHSEQGYGDSLQFVRFVPNVIARGGRVILRVTPAVFRLLQPFRHVEGVESVITTEDPLPQFEVHAPLLSLTHLLQVPLDQLNPLSPYLTADEQQCERWRQKLADEKGVLNVGLVWAGRPEHINDLNRSMTLSALSPLALVPNVRFVNLQIGPAAAQIATAPAGMRIVDFTAELNDFADTAALVANLDLVICVDTAIAHLAGALGRPAWVLLPHVPDWRWMLNRSDSPWYPSVRLFRQQKRQDWNLPVAEVTAALREFAAAKA